MESTLPSGEDGETLANFPCHQFWNLCGLNFQTCRKFSYVWNTPSVYSDMPESVSAKAVCGGVDTRRVLTGRAIDSVATSQDVCGMWIWGMGYNLCSFKIMAKIIFHGENMILNGFIGFHGRFMGFEWFYWV